MREAIPLDGEIIHLFQVGVERPVAVTLFQVDQEAMRTGRIADAMQADTLRSGHLGLHAIVHQQGVVARSHLLIGMFVVGRGRALDIILLTTCRAYVARIRHQQHVA